jgi:uncharacterized membrane protein
MTTTYNRLAGQNIERLSALSDGVFAFAMTLLVVDLRTPLGDAIHSEHGLLQALGAMGPQVISYLMSFVTLGIFWNGQEAQFGQFARGNRHLTWIHLAFLFFVTLLPFSTRLLAEYISYRTALLFVLEQHSAARRGALCQLVLCALRRVAEGRRDGRGG